MELEIISKEFGLDTKFKPHKIGSGHINETYLVLSEEGQKMVLQKINTQVFGTPEDLMSNLLIIIEHLESTDYPYPLVKVIPTQSGNQYLLDKSGCWRLLSFLEGKEAAIDRNKGGITGIVAQGYGNFLKYMSTLDTSLIKETIPDFHNPETRFQQFISSVESADPRRQASAQSLIDHALALSGITSIYANCIKNLPLRITHGDAKASNILLNTSGNTIAGIIDLDTVMPGYLMNDIGDMVRSMCNTGSEDESDLSKVSLDLEIFYQLVYGFLKTTHEFLTQEELDSFLQGISAILYEQFLRFLSDYLSGDVYYTTHYENQNLNRAKVHLKLLIDFQAREEFLIRIINQCLSQIDSDIE